MTAVWDVKVGGRPVPWITSWSAEVESLVAARDRLGNRSDQVQVGAIVGEDVDGSSWHRLDIGTTPNRATLTRKGGWWWQFYADAQGEGEPAWADVNARRQRLSMLKHLCQVCARPLPRPSRREPVEWVLAQRLNRQSPLLHGSWPDDGTVLTVDAPTCPQCADIAERMCPALRRHSERVQVVAAEPWGVNGDAFDVAGSGVERVAGVFQDVGSDVKATAIARQLVVALTLAD